MYELGEVTLEDIRGCYDVETINSYIDIKVVQDSEMVK